MNRATTGDGIRRKGREGVALLVVLGMLSLLLIMGVAFSVSMRTERSGAGNFAAGVLSKQLVMAALADAVEEIDLRMGFSNLTSTAAATNYIMYPDWDVINSDPGGSIRSAVRLGWGDGLAHVPQVFHSILVTNEAYWLDGAVSHDQAVIGRRAFTAINCSGLLNANKVGENGRSRDQGASPREIQLANLSDFANLQAVTDFLDDRDMEHIRYESTKELADLNVGLSSNVHFVVESMAGLDPDIVYLPSNDTDIASSSTEIKAAFTRAGIQNSVTRDRAMRNLLDYVDDDNVPQDRRACNGEAVPLVNEVIMEYLLGVQPAGVCLYGVTLDVEWAYPFAEVRSGESYKLSYQADFEALGANTHPEFVPTGPLNANQSITPSVAGYGTIQVGAAPTPVIITNPATINFRVTLSDVAIKEGGTTVNELDKDLTIDVLIPNVRHDAFTPTIETHTNWVECIDPRFNWDPSNAAYASRGLASQWVPGPFLTMVQGAVGDYTASATKAAENSFASWIIQHPEGVTGVLNPSDYDADNLLDAIAHVANRPIQSVGELGNLCLQPWYTLRLYDHGEGPFSGQNPPYHRVLDYFSRSQAKGKTTRGLVNVNTIETEVLASVLLDMPVKEYDSPAPNIPPNPASRAPLDWNESLDIADEIINGGPYTNLADLGQVDWPFVSTNILSGPWRTRELSKEAVIRNTADLLTTRQNLFVVLLAGGPFSRGVGIVARQGKMGDWLGTQRAVAVLWRDPIPSPDSGRCPVALVYFKWLED